MECEFTGGRAHLAYVEQVVADAATLPLDQVQPRLPYETPPKIWCIGLNYLSHAEDINAVQPEEPGSFMKPASCLTGLNRTAYDIQR